MRQVDPASANGQAVRRDVVQHAVHEIVAHERGSHVGNIGRDAGFAHRFDHGPDGQRRVIGRRPIGHRHHVLQDLACIVAQAIACAVIQILRDPLDGDHGAAAILAHHHEALRLLAYDCVTDDVDAFEEPVGDHTGNDCSAFNLRTV
jgi:hypothetical protein